MKIEVETFNQIPDIGARGREASPYRPELDKLTAPGMVVHFSGLDGRKENARVITTAHSWAKENDYQVTTRSSAPNGTVSVYRLV